VDHGLIYFDFEQRIWNWDEERISKLEVSEDIVEYLIQHTLQDTINLDTVEILQLAACLGNREFNTYILSNVTGLPAEEVRSLCYLFDLRLRRDCGPL
jgi:predicted ATPase